jgi:hypothetical protein
MLFGFELFMCLKSDLSADTIEVYPFAIVRAFLPACAHKSNGEGLPRPTRRCITRTGWEPQKLEAKLKLTVPGSRHDRLDAFMAPGLRACR